LITSKDHCKTPSITTTRTPKRGQAARGAALAVQPIRQQITGTKAECQTRSAAFNPARALKMTPQDRRISVAGLVLVRQMPGSAHGVIFISLEDETEIGNLVVWPAVFEKYRRTILSSSMLGCRGKVQREGEVIHLVAEHLIDLSVELRRIGELEGSFNLPTGRGDQVTHSGRPDQRERTGFHRNARDIYIPDLRLETLKVKARNFH
jgi:error-prone DNA polymerase